MITQLFQEEGKHAGFGRRVNVVQLFNHKLEVVCFGGLNI